MSDRNWWREPARYYFMRGGKIIRRPHEDFKPLDPNSPLAHTDFAALECRTLGAMIKDNTMNFTDFLNRVIDDGIAAANESYKTDDLKREGAVAGFEACRDKTDFELRQLCFAASNMVNVAVVLERERYWYHRCFHAEIEWVCNVVSVILQNEGIEPIVMPTARGYLKAAEIVGVKNDLTLKRFVEQAQD